MPVAGSGGGGAAIMPAHSAAPGAARLQPNPDLNASALTAAPLTDELGRPLLGTLRTATHWLWFYAAEDEPLVTICDRRGNVLAAAIPQSNVYRLFPELNLDTLQDSPETRQLMHAEPPYDGD